MRHDVIIRCEQAVLMSSISRRLEKRIDIDSYVSGERVFTCSKSSDPHEIAGVAAPTAFLHMSACDLRPTLTEVAIASLLRSWLVIITAGGHCV